VVEVLVRLGLPVTLTGIVECLRWTVLDCAPLFDPGIEGLAERAEILIATPPGVLRLLQCWDDGKSRAEGGALTLLEWDGILNDRDPPPPDKFLMNRDSAAEGERVIRAFRTQVAEGRRLEDSELARLQMYMIAAALMRVAGSVEGGDGWGEIRQMLQGDLRPDAVFVELSESMVLGMGAFLEMKELGTRSLRDAIDLAVDGVLGGHG